MRAPKRVGKRAGRGWLAVAMLLVAAAPGWAQTGRFLGREDILLYGLGLRVEPASQTVPKDIATIVSTYLQAPQLPSGLPPFAPDAVVKGTLRGPGLPAPLELSVQPNAPFPIPPLTVAGVYTLENIRLESQGAVLLRSTPESAQITVIDQLLVTQITARALSAAEIREKGIVFDSSNFQAYNFTAAFALQGGNPVNVSFPVLLPSVESVSDVNGSRVTIGSVSAPTLTSLKTVVPDTLKLATQIPNLTVMGFTLNVPEMKGQELSVPPIPGVIVIPGDIGFLNQYFSVMLMVGNAAPAGSGLSVTDLRAEIVLPPGNDRVVNSPDDPLRMAMTSRGEALRVQAVVQAGPDGQLGTADDVATLGPGESGNAEYLVEGRREGSHTVEMAISGMLLGLPVGPVAITGRAVGAVLVRNPTFTLTFTHPDIVAAGEPYSLDVTVTNTSSSPANFVSVNLFGPNISGASLVGEPTREIESIPPGDSATVSFDLVSRVSGKVTASTLDSDENVAGRFQMKTAVGADGIPLSPDSLVLPKEASALPKSLRDAALGLLGKAWAVATAPAGALPKDVTRFSKQIVLDRAIEVAEAGFRVSLHEPTADSAAQLLMDFAGSNYARIADLYAASDQPFHRDNYSGFDALRRSSIRGDVFASAVSALLAPELAAHGGAAFHRALAGKWNYRPGFVSVLLSSPTAPAPFDVAVIDGSGRQVGGTGDAGKFIKQIPFSDVLPLTGTAGQPAGTLLVIATPEDGTYTVRLTRVPGTTLDASFTLSILMPAAERNGRVRELLFEGLTGAATPTYEPLAGEPVRFAFAMAGGGLPEEPAPLAATGTVIPDAAPTVVSVVQQPDADTVSCDDYPEAKFRLGRVVAVLFSEEVAAASVQDRLTADRITAFAPEANRAVSVALQPGRRIAFVALRDPLGTYVPRTMTVTGVEDLRANPLTSWTGPMEATLDRGAVVSGRIIQADGTAVPGADVRLFAILPCELSESKVGVSQKYADAEGRYSWDFVSSDLTAVITAIDPGTQEWRSIPFSVSRPGQRMNVDLALLGRGTLAGRVLGPDGRTPLPNSQLRVTSLTDHSQYGATTDLRGAFAIPRIPVGSLFVEAVNVDARAHYNFSEHIPLAGATVTRDIVLVPAASQQLNVRVGRLSGHVLRSDGATPVADAAVVAYYQNNSQPGVLCPAQGDEHVIPNECAAAVARTGPDGSFAIPELTAGEYRISAFDQPSLTQGEVRFTLSEGNASLTVLLQGGLATVRGMVLDSQGARVAGARVGGGLTLTTTDANGVFVLTDVPVGRREIVAVSDTLGVRGSAEVDIVSAGEEVNATIVLQVPGSIAGRVVLSDGGTPAANVPVYVFKIGEGGSLLVVGQATTDASGAYRIDRIVPDQYQVSAFARDFSDGNVVPAVLRYGGQVLRADIRFRGAGGRVSGTLLNGDGTTPLVGRVGLSGARVQIAGGMVGVGFVPVTNYAIVDTGADGRFAFSGLFVGDFTLRAVGVFSPDPIQNSGRIETPGQEVVVNLRLQDTSQVAGTIFQPDGVTPAPNVTVTYRSSAFRTVCSDELNEAGDNTCTDVPQGVQEEFAVTDASGRFLVPLVNAGAFTLSFLDPATGKVAHARGAVRPGERAEMTARLLGRGTLTVRVLSSDGRTPIPGARVELAQPEFPKAFVTMFADAQGVLVLGGGDALSEGEVAIFVRDVRNGFTGRGSARIAADAEQVSTDVYIFDASGTVSGTVYKADGVTPVANAEVVISVNGRAIGYAVAGPDGRFSHDTVPLGPFAIDVFEALTGRVGYAGGRIDLDKQHVVLNVTELALGTVTGTVIDSSVMSPLPGWSVQLTPRSASGRSLPALNGMSGIDGTFSFPGVAKGLFSLTARVQSLAAAATGAGEIFAEGQRVDIPLLVRLPHALYGTLEGTVRNPDGTPAAYATVSVTDGPNGVADASGAFSFPQLLLGRYRINAQAQSSANAGSVWADLAYEGDLVHVTIPMVGLTAVHGQAVYADGSPASHVQVTFAGVPASGCEGTGTEAGCVKFADANGEFAFTQLPARWFTLSAADPVRNLKGSVGGPLNPGEDRALRVVLQPSAAVAGRVLSAAGTPAAGVTCELTIGDQHLFVGTGADGRFSYPAVPLAAYHLDFSDPIGTGVARRSGTFTADVDFGDVLLDEAAPRVGSLTPAASASRVPLDQVFTIVFTEPVDPGGVTASGISLVGPSGLVSAVLDLHAGDTTVTLTPVGTLRDESRYSLKVTGIKDRLGKVMADYTASFTTVDITPPAVVDLSPADGASGVPIYTPIRVKFSEPIDVTAWGATPLALSVSGHAVAGRTDYLYGNTVLVFTPAIPLADGLSYRVQLAAATDLAANVQGQGLDYSFSTTDRTPPVITALSALTGPAVIENTIARVRPDVGAFDVAVVDYYLNGAIAGSSRTAPFDFAFQAVAALGQPGDTITVTAIATDTSGNRGPISPPLSLTVRADQPPTVTITAPATASSYGNGARVTVALQASDDVGLATLAYRAQTGKPQDAGTVTVTPTVTERTAGFAFDVPLDAAPGSLIQIQASAVDSKGQVTPAVPVSFTVLDAVGPTVAISGTATGDRIKAGQLVTVTLNAADAGGLQQLTFVATGAAAASETRSLPGAPQSVITSFSFTVSPLATTGQTVALDATARDLTGNATAAARVLLTVSDMIPPVVTLRTADGSTTVLPGQSLEVVAQATDDQAVARVDLTGQGGFPLNDSRQVSPPSNSATLRFPVTIPPSAAAGSQLVLTGRAADVSGNLSGQATLTLLVGSALEVGMPASIVMVAGETRTVEVVLSAAAPAGGQVVAFSTADRAVAFAAASVTIPEGEARGSVAVTANAGGTTAISAFLYGALRASTTVAVQGGVVSGRVFDDFLLPVAGARVTVGASEATTTDGDGRYQVTGVPGTRVLVKAVDPISEKRGSTIASLNQENGYARDVNLVLIAAGSVAGVVFQADGTTPAGAGVQVDVYASGDLSNALNTTYTDAASRFEFPVVTQGSYVIHASSTSGSRGRATVAVLAGQDHTVNVTFLGVGTVTGVVRDGANVPVPNAQVVFNSSSVFGAGPVVTVAAALDGVYTIPSVLVGSFWIRVTDSRTGQAGIASGVVGQDGETVTVDVSLASFGSIRGTVYRSDGVTTVANAHVVIQKDYTSLWTDTDSDGRYSFPVVPLGSYAIGVHEAATRGVGRTNATIAFNGDTQTADVILLPQGTLVVTVLDASGHTVPGASVTVSARASSDLSDTLNGVTGEDGQVVVSHILAGTFSVTAASGGLTGVTSGVLAGGATLPVTVRLEPVASIAGTVVLPNGETPASGVVGLMLGDSTTYGLPLAQVPIAADGSFRFDGLRLERYRVFAFDEAARWRAISPAVSLSSAGQVAAVNLRFVGLGRVTGRVLNIDSSSAGSTHVEVRALNATFGRYWTTVTDAAGYYAVNDVPVGAVSVLAGSVASGLFAEGAGAVAADGQVSVIDLLLKNNSTYFPVTLFDGNGTSLEISPNGMAKTGTPYVFDDSDGGGLKLELESGGVTTPFTGTPTGTLEAGGRQVVTRQQGIAGLDVTRRVYVPIDGYFARYLDTLGNPGGSAVTVNVWVSSYVQAATLVRTSSGDNVMDASSPSTPDRWVTLDDSSDGPASAPALAFVFDGPGAASRVDTAAFAPSNSVVWRWGSVTVPPGGSVSFLHFASLQATRAAAQATAERLTLLPPEALVHLRQEDIAGIRNFVVPPGGASEIAALPSLAGTVAGQVLEADSATPVPWAPVTFTSALPYFPRTHAVYADEYGNFRLEAVLDGSASAVAVPAFDFALSALYPGTGIASPVVAGGFGPGQLLATRNILFSTTAGIRGSVRQADASVVTSGTVTLTGTWNGTTYNRSTAIASDGTFSFRGLPPANLSLTARLPSPQGSELTASTEVALVAGQTTDVTVTLPATGTVVGIVRTGGGAAAANIAVRLAGAAGFTRTATTDTGGAFTLVGVPIGTYTLSATEPGSGLATTASVEVTAGGTTTQNLQLVAVGIVRGTVRNAANEVVPGLAVELVTSGRGAFETTTNASGAYQFTGVPLGTFLVSATSAALGQYGELAGTVASDGQQVVADITMTANIVALPRTRYDANSLRFDVQQNGRIRYGENNAFRGYSDSYDTAPYGASTLSVTTGGVETAFAGAATAVGEHGNRELAIRQTGVAGLDVTRKIYIPETGYFARYLEVLSNPGSTAVTVDVKVAHTLGYGATSYWWGWTGNIPAIRTTSSGDTTLDVTSAGTPDRWVVFDDNEQTDMFGPGASGNSLPATAFVFDGAAAAQRVASAVFTRGTWGDLTCSWNGVTVPPGGRVILMHFVVQQNSTAAGTASAERLAQLPPEAIFGMAEDERALVANHAVPADGSSSVTPLPSLTGTVTGRVLEADGTPVGHATARFASSVPYFSRARTVQADETGLFRFSSSFDQWSNVVIPVGNFTVSARHPRTSIESTAAAGSFPDGQSTATKDVVFTNTGTLTGVLRRASGVPVPENWISIQSGTSYDSQSTDSTGRFTFRGLAPGQWNLQATLSGSQWLVATSTVTTVGGQTTSQDVAFPPSGAVQGVVYNADGSRPSYASVYIQRASDGQSYSTYGYDGSYLFTDVPLGSYILYAYEPRTSARIEVPITILQDQVISQDIRLPAVGSLQVQVNFARGDAAGGARVDIRDAGTGGNFSYRLYVDAAGRGTIPNVAAGPVTVRAYHPVDSSFYADVDTTVATEGQMVPLTVTLPALVSVRARVTASSGTPIPSVAAYLYESSNLNSYLRSAYTDASGIAAFSGLFRGGTSFTVRGQREVSGYNSYYLSALSAPVTPSTDGETATAEVTLPSVASRTIALVRPDGTPFTGELALYVRNDFRQYFEFQSYTNSTTGQATLRLPEGSYTIRVRDGYSGATLIDDTGSIQPADEGTTATVTIVVGAVSGTLTGQVFAADGVTPMPSARVFLLNAADRQEMRSTTAAADGRYTFSSVRSGPGGFLVRVLVPYSWSSYYTTATEVPATLTTEGQAATVNVTIPFAFATIAGQATSADGAMAIGWAPVRFLNQAGTTIASTSTSGTGAFGPTTVLAEAAGVRVRAFEPGGVVFAEHLQLPVPAGGTFSLNLAVPVYYGTISGRVMAADGRTAVRYADLQVQTTAGGLSSFGTDANGVFTTSTWVPTQGAVLRAWYSDGTAADMTPALIPIDLSASRSLTLDVTLPLSVVTGYAKGANGTPLPYFQAWTIGGDSITRDPMTVDSATGRFVILGNPSGPFTTYVQDRYDPCFTGSVAATMDDITVPGEIDVRLPAGGQIDVQVVGLDGAGVGTGVTASAPGSFPGDDTYTDDTTGRATITVPAGPVWLQACLYDQPCASVSGTVPADGTVSLVLEPKPTGSLEGRLFKADGVTPYANTTVSVESRSDSGWWEAWAVSVRTDAEGRFTVTHVPAGTVFVELWDYSVRGAIRVPVTIVAGRANTMQAAGGSGVYEARLASGGAEFRPYDEGWLNTASFGSFGNPYSYSYTATLMEGLETSSYYPDASLAQVSPGGRQVEYGAMAGAALTFQRRLGVPGNKPFIRYLEIVRNPTSVPLPASVLIDASPRVVNALVAAAVTGNRYVITGPAAGASGAAIAHVIAGGGAAAVKAGVLFEPGRSFEYVWSTTVPPGGTVMFMHFSVIGDPADPAGLQAQAEALANLTDPDALFGLTEQERARIVNFAVPGGAADLAGRIAGRVVAADGTTAVAGARVEAFDSLTGFSRAVVITDGNGAFQFDDVANGEFGIGVAATLSGYPGQSAGAAVTFTQAGEVVSGLVLTMPAGVGAGNAPVSAAASASTSPAPLPSRPVTSVGEGLHHE